MAALGALLWRVPRVPAAIAKRADAEAHGACPSIGCRARLPERVRATGCGLALDRVLRDVDDGAGRGRAAADDPGRERGAHEDGSRARRRRCVRARHAGDGSGTTSAPTSWCSARMSTVGEPGARDHPSRRPAAGLAGGPDHRAGQRDQSREGRPAARLADRRAPARTAGRRCAAGRRRLPRSRPLSRPAPTRRASTPRGWSGSGASTPWPRATCWSARLPPTRRFPLAHSALALTWATLGYDERARSAVEPGLQAVVRSAARGTAVGGGRVSGDGAGVEGGDRDLPDALPVLPRQSRIRPAPGQRREQLRRPEGRARHDRDAAQVRGDLGPAARARRGGCGREHLGLQTHAGGGGGRRGTRQGAGRKTDRRPRGTARRDGGAAARGAGAGDRPLRSGPRRVRGSWRPRPPCRGAQQPGVRARRHG